MYTNVDISGDTITIKSTDHSDPKESQLILVLTGNANDIRNQLLRLAKEIAVSKPTQGTSVMPGECMVSVITPIWNKQSY